MQHGSYVIQGKTMYTTSSQLVHLSKQRGNLIYRSYSAAGVGVPGQAGGAICFGESHHAGCQLVIHRLIEKLDIVRSFRAINSNINSCQFILDILLKTSDKLNSCLTLIYSDKIQQMVWEKKAASYHSAIIQATTRKILRDSLVTWYLLTRYLFYQGMP